MQLKKLASVKIWKILKYTCMESKLFSSGEISKSFQETNMKSFRKFFKKQIEKSPKIFQKQKDENVLKIFPKSPNQKI